jgi:hypothetical protein
MARKIDLLYLYCTSMKGHRPYTKYSAQAIPVSEEIPSAEKELTPAEIKRLPGRRVVIRQVGTWKAIAAAIAQYPRIGRLVLDFHGGPGGLDPGHAGFTEYLDAPRVRKLFATRCQQIGGCRATAVTGSRFCATHRPAGDKPWYPTQIDRIDFPSCNVGRDPARLGAFAAIFNAQTVGGYTWFQVTGYQSFIFAKGQTEQEIEQQLRRYRRWLSDNIPSSTALARSCKSAALRIRLPVEFYTPTGSEAHPIGFPGGTANPALCKPASEATLRHIFTLGQAQTVTGEFAKYVQEYPPFEHITVHLVTPQMTARGEAHVPPFAGTRPGPRRAPGVVGQPGRRRLTR